MNRVVKLSSGETWTYPLTELDRRNILRENKSTRRGIDNKTINIRWAKDRLSILSLLVNLQIKDIQKQNMKPSLKVVK